MIFVVFSRRLPMCRSPLRDALEDERLTPISEAMKWNVLGAASERARGTSRGAQVHRLAKVGSLYREGCQTALPG